MQSTSKNGLVKCSRAVDPEIELASRAATLGSALSAAMVSVARIMDELPPMEDFATREKALLVITNEISRRLMAADLQRVADSFPDEVTVRGERYRRHATGTVAYHSLCGDLLVTRDTYRQIGIHNGPTIVPLELASGLVQGATPGLGYSVAQGLADMTSRQYEETMRAAGRRPPSRSSVSRLASGVGGAAKQDVELIEAILRQDEPLPEGAHAIAVGSDRTTVPMAEEIPPAEAERTRPLEDYVRTPPPPIEVRYRMAYVGTVSVVDKQGEPLRTLRYGATAEEGAQELVRRMMADVKHLREQKSLPVAIVQDGAEELWGLMWDGLRSIGIKKWAQAIDCYHVAEHMNAALDAARSVVTTRGIRDRYIARVDKSDYNVRDFCRWLKATCEGTRKWTAIEPHYNYLFMADLSRRTRYATMRKRGFPTGSGVTEGACKSLIAKRFKGGGQRWQQDGLTAILTLRALRLSDRLATFWGLFRNRYRAIVEC